MGTKTPAEAARIIAKRQPPVSEQARIAAEYYAKDLVEYTYSARMIKVMGLPRGTIWTGTKHRLSINEYSAMFGITRQELLLAERRYHNSRGVGADCKRLLDGSGRLRNPELATDAYGNLINK